MANQVNVIETIVMSLVQQAPTGGVQEIVNTLVSKEAHPDADVPKGIVAGLVAGVAGTLAKTFIERIFPVTAPDPAAQRTLSVGDQELHVNIDTREWVTGVLVGGAYGAAAELAPEVTAAGGLGLGSALYGINNTGAVVSADKVSVKPQEENEAHELLSDMVFGLVTEFVRQTVRNRLAPRPNYDVPTAANRDGAPAAAASPDSAAYA